MMIKNLKKKQRMMNKANSGIIAGFFLIFIVVVVIIGGYYIIHLNSSAEKILNYGKNYSSYSYVDYDNSSNFTYERVYPNIEYTTGDLLTTNKEIVCNPNYLSTIKGISKQTKMKIFKNYGIDYPQPSSIAKIDNFIPLEIGGSNAEKNLWVMLYPEFEWKNKVEQYLYDKVCKEGSMDLEQAQALIRTNWYKIYIQIK